MERSLSLYRDGNLEWNKGTGTLSLKAPQGNDSAKLKKSLKYDFSFANWGEATERWLKGVKKRYATLFPDVSKQARVLAGIKVKGSGTSTESESSESGADSSGRDLDSDYEGLSFANLKVSDDNHQNNVDGHGWNGDSDHDATGGGNTDERLGTDAGNHQLEGSGDNEDGDQQEGNDGHCHTGSRQHSDNEADNEQDDGDRRECEEYGEEHLGDEVAGDGDYEMLGVEERASGDELSELTYLSDADSGSNDGKQIVFIEQLC